MVYGSETGHKCRADRMVWVDRDGNAPVNVVCLWGMFDGQFCAQSRLNGPYSTSNL